MEHNPPALLELCWSLALSHAEGKATEGQSCGPCEMGAHPSVSAVNDQVSCKFQFETLVVPVEL